MGMCYSKEAASRSKYVQLALRPESSSTLTSLENFD